MITCGIDEAGRGPLCGPVCAAAVSFFVGRRNKPEIDCGAEQVAEDSSVPETASERKTGFKHQNLAVGAETNLEARTPTSLPKFADSKKLGAETRGQLAEIIRARCAYGIGWAYPHEIDALNIHHATLLAMKRAFIAMLSSNECFRPHLHFTNNPGSDAYLSHTPLNTINVLIDGKFVPDICNLTAMDFESLPEPRVSGVSTMAMDAPNTLLLPISSRAVIGGDDKVEEIMAASILAKTARDSLMLLYDHTYPQYGLASHKGYPTPFHKKAIAYYGANGIYRRSFKWE